MSSVESRVAVWASSLPYWEQLALSWILAGRSLDDGAFNELLIYLLQEHDLVDEKLPLRELSLAPAAVVSPSVERVVLLAVHGLKNVNALVPGQRLEFCEEATAIFGSNGAGKSGYARLLGCVGFTRGDKDVLPDARSSKEINAPRSAKIDLRVAGSNKTIDLTFDGALHELPSVHVFDSTSVHVHLTGSNRLSFAPLGLACLTRLAEVTDEVRNRLSQRIQLIESGSNPFVSLLEGNSKVRTLLAALGEATDMDAVRNLAAFGSEEKAALEEAELRVAKAKSTSSEEQKLDLTRAAKAMTGLTNDLQLIANPLVQEGIDATIGVIDAVVAAQRRVAAVSIDEFKLEGLSQIGTSEWRRFIEAAQALAEAEATADGEYPRAGRPCLLCHRPLDGVSRDLIRRLSAYLEKESQAQLATANANLVLKAEALTALGTKVLDSASIAYEVLEKHDPGLLSELLSLQKTLQATRDSLLVKIGSLDPKPDVLEASTGALAKLDAFRSKLLRNAGALDKGDRKADIVPLIDQWRELDHRRQLLGLLPEVEQFVHDRKWAAIARKISGSTAHITKQYNQLFTELVTEQYVERFRGFLKELGRPMIVDVVTFGKKGEVQKRVSLTVEAGAGWALTDKILSEGEKRAVALADFLSEVATDTRSSTIVLDDPVTSLDLEWREQIAGVLARQAKALQVIVFTHDLPFLYYFSRSCEEEGLALRTHWVRRGESDGLPGYVSLDNCPSMEKEYKTTKRALALWEGARGAGPESQERILKDGFGALRTTYEAFIVFDLFGGVVERFQERISVGRLGEAIWDKSIVDDIVKRYEALSRHIEGHLHSDAMAAKKPTPDDLKREIDAFAELKQRLRTMKQRPAGGS